MERDDAIKLYFHMGLLYKDITRGLALNHGLVVSLRQVKRILRKHGLSRRKNYSPGVDIVNFVHDQIRSSGQMHGYRWMFEKCLEHGLVCEM